MRKYAFGGALVVVTLAMTPLFVRFRAFGQEAKPSDPIFGTWVMEVNKSFSSASTNRQLSPLNTCGY